MQFMQSIFLVGGSVLVPQYLKPAKADLVIIAKEENLLKQSQEDFFYSNLNLPLCGPAIKSVCGLIWSFLPQSKLPERIPLEDNNIQHIIKRKFALQNTSATCYFSRFIDNHDLNISVKLCI